MIFSIRKLEKVLKSSLESIIVPMFCSAMMRANEDQKSKLNKVKFYYQDHFTNNFDKLFLLYTVAYFVGNKKSLFS